MPLSDEDKAEIGKLIASSLSGEGFTSAVSAAVEAQVAGAVKSLKLDELVSSSVATALEKNKGAGSGAGDGDGKPGAAGDESAEMRKMKARMEEMERKNKAAEEARQAAEAKERTGRLHSRARQALLDAGADPTGVSHAMAYLTQNGTLAYNDDDQAAFRFTRKWGDELVAADLAAAEWLQTDDGKRYLPPKSVRGTGTHEGRSPGGRGSTVSAASVLGAAIGAA